MKPEMHEDKAVFAPHSKEEAAEFFRECTGLKASGLPVGLELLECPGGWKRGSLPAPVPASESLALISERKSGTKNILVSHGGFDRIHEISHSDLLAVAGGGVKYAELRESVEREGLYLPFAPELPAEGLALAGMVLGGDISYLETRYGRLRESILSLGLVTPKGEMINTGSRAVKDVAGYELAGFVAGAGGRCGMLERMTVRLLPGPGTVVTGGFKGDYGTLADLGRRIFAGMSPVGLEIYSPAAADLFLPDQDEPPDFENGYLLLFELHEAREGFEEELVSRVRALAADNDFSYIEGSSISKARETAASVMTGRMDCPEGAAYISLDVREIDMDASPRLCCWSSMYPHRTGYLWPADPGEGRDLVPGVKKALAENAAPGFRLRAYELARDGDSVAARSLTAGFGDRPREGLAARIEEYLRSDALDELSSRICSVFDPEGIMAR